jgi:hypothetical protein
MNIKLLKPGLSTIVTGTDDIQFDSVRQVTKLGKDLKNVGRGLETLVKIHHCQTDFGFKVTHLLV